MILKVLGWLRFRYFLALKSMGTVVWQAFSNDYIIYDENIPCNVHGQTIVLLVCDYNIF
jgi:phage terminase large subunit-like protein